MQKSVLPVFSSRSFIVSGLRFRFLIHFRFIFVCGMRKYFYSILLYVVFLAFTDPFFEETVFPSLYILASFDLD